MKIEAEEIKEMKEVQEKSGGRGAAFFDIDGTLLAKPSLERRFFAELRWQGKIPAQNYFFWLAEAIRLGSRDLYAATQANKAYLRGVSAESLFAISAKRRTAWMPEFFPAAVQRIWWHALRGDAIVLVSGTLLPLAEIVGAALERELLWRGIDATVAAVATKPEVAAGRFTGRVAGTAMFAEEKARAVQEFAGEQKIALCKCSAYGDSSLDRWMLAAVGHPFLINPTRRLRRIALLRGWQILEWTHAPLRTVEEQRGVKTPLKLTSLKRNDQAAR
jgi:HAD superfamily hydrolase (TIGR01490 family)